MANTGGIIRGRAGVAQSAERLTRNEQVRGSIPLLGSRDRMARVRSTNQPDSDIGLVRVFSCSRRFGSDPYICRTSTRNSHN